METCAWLGSIIALRLLLLSPTLLHSRACLFCLFFFFKCFILSGFHLVIFLLFLSPGCSLPLPPSVSTYIFLSFCLSFFLFSILTAASHSPSHSFTQRSPPYLISSLTPSLTLQCLFSLPFSLPPLSLPSPFSLSLLHSPSTFHFLFFLLPPPSPSLDSLL